MKKFSAALFLPVGTILLFSSQWSLATDLPHKIHESKERLQAIHQNVANLRHSLAEKQKTQAELRQEIKTLDEQIRQSQNKLQQIQQRQHHTQTEIASLQAQIQQLEGQLQQQKQILSDQLRAAYMLGSETPLAVWLQTERPAEIGRLSVYYQSLAKARLELIQKTQDTQTQIQQHQKERMQQEQQLTRLAAQTESQEKHLQEQRRQHAALEEQLVQRIAADQAKISNLEANAQILNGLVTRLSQQYQQQLAAERAAAAQRAREAAARRRAAERLAAERARAAQAAAAARARQEAAAQAREEAAEQARARQLQQELQPTPPPSVPVQTPRIATLPAPSVAPKTPTPAAPAQTVGTGNFPMPVNAPVQHLFGTPRMNGGPNWEGITFAASPGSPVHAIAPGMVLYAGPLRGYGEIVIIQQAGLILAIYGHLSNPAVHVGQQVQTGSLIGSVGSGGSMSEDGLYLEIRSHGHPVNPLQYLR